VLIIIMTTEIIVIYCNIDRNDNSYILKYILKRYEIYVVINLIIHFIMIIKYFFKYLIIIYYLSIKNI